MTDSDTLTIEINDQKITCEKGESIIDIADRHGIPIPRFCYHPKLSVVASCRMCLVDVESSNKPLPACKTQVQDGMKIHTRSDKAIESQQAIMEFLLINHPLDCPICDQAGECELQDVSMGFGFGESNYRQSKRVVKDEDLGPLIATDMTRCIHCSRCVRFGDEVGGMPELGLVDRGGQTKISTYLEKTLQSEMSGNMIDLCPVGAITSKPHRYIGRSWSYKQHASISPHDCVGSHLYYHSADEKSQSQLSITRVVPKPCEPINENWLSNRDRFSYLGIEHEDRIKTPMIKRSDTWVEVDWSEALHQVNKILQTQSSQSIYGMMSPTATIEEMYLFRQWLELFGCYHFDHRLKETDFDDQAEMPLYPGSLELSLESIEEMDSILVIGGNIRHEQPLLNHRIRKAVTQNQTRVHELNMTSIESNYKRESHYVSSPQKFALTLATWLDTAQQCLQSEAEPIAQQTIEAQALEVGRKMIDCLSESKKTLVILGLSAQRHPQASQIRRMTKKLAKICKSHLIFVTDGPNSAGGWITGMLPHRRAFGAQPETIGMSCHQAWEQKDATYVLYQVEPDHDCFNPQKTITALNNAKHVISFQSYRNPVLEQNADIILPLSSHVENAGTFVNITGQWQSFRPCISHLYNSRPGWKILQKLASIYNHDHQVFDDVSHWTDVIKRAYTDMSAKFTRIPTRHISPIKELPYSLMRLSQPDAFQTDAVTRRSYALQQTIKDPVATIHRDTAKQLNIDDGQEMIFEQNEVKFTIKCVIDDHTPSNTILMPSIQHDLVLGAMIGHIHIVRGHNDE